MVAVESRAQEKRLHGSPAPDSTRTVSLAPPLRPNASQTPGGGWAICPAAAGRPAPGEGAEAGTPGRGSRAAAHLPRPTGPVGRSCQVQVGPVGGAPRLQEGTPGARGRPRWASRPSGAGGVGPGATACELEIPALIPPPTGQIAAFSLPLLLPFIAIEIWG